MIIFNIYRVYKESKYIITEVEFNVGQSLDQESATAVVARLWSPKRFCVGRRKNV